MNEPLVHRHWAVLAAPKVAPAIGTSTVLILGRIWTPTEPNTARVTPR